jgi:type VI secretion system secreted protein VgrG
MKPEFVLPITQPQIATVISKTDPSGQGRITVRFDWQMYDTTNFIRMMSPDAGRTDQITQNRGYFAIPEVGDQIMVNFVHNHPDRPFVMGGMFHGGVGLGGGINNHMRSIQTKSGIKVLLNDDEGSVNIIDPSGNTYFMEGREYYRNGADEYDF